MAEEDNAATHVLLETTIAGLFILQKNSRVRARVFYAHSIFRQDKMFRDWKRTKGLKRHATTKVLAQSAAALTTVAVSVPAGNLSAAVLLAVSYWKRDVADSCRADAVVGNDGQSRSPPPRVTAPVLPIGDTEP